MHLFRLERSRKYTYSFLLILSCFSEAKVIYDPHTSKPKGYGFVSFRKRAEAERAIEQMNGKVNLLVATMLNIL
jgi:RNA recognition motif-containing protein